MSTLGPYSFDAKEVSPVRKPRFYWTTWSEQELGGDLDIEWDGSVKEGFRVVSNKSAFEDRPSVT